MHKHLVAALLACGLAGCPRASQPAQLRYVDRDTFFVAGDDVVARAGGHRVPGPPAFDGRYTLLGAKLPAHAAPGETVRITAWLMVDRENHGAPLAFAHAQIPGAEVNQATADHKIIGGRVAPEHWQMGDILVDAFDLTLPRALAGNLIVVRYGLFEDKQRLTVTPGQVHDGKHRVELGGIFVDGGPPVDVKGVAHKRAAPIVVDGVLDEPDWQRAEKLGPFQSHDGKSDVRSPTFARILWDEDNLYVAFEAVDRDVFTPYTKRDDKLYESEAVEIFIDADGDGDEYVELQAAPNDVHFDAAFRDGRRKNMDTAYDVPFETKTVVRGTLSQGDDVDEGFTSEWRIPIAALRDVPNKPAVGAQWRINLFRLDRQRSGTRVVGTEATAWSSPLSGDFHNLARMATLELAD